MHFSNFLENRKNTIVTAKKNFTSKILISFLLIAPAKNIVSDKRLKCRELYDSNIILGVLLLRLVFQAAFGSKTVFQISSINFQNLCISLNISFLNIFCKILFRLPNFLCGYPGNERTGCNPTSHSWDSTVSCPKADFPCDKGHRYVLKITIKIKSLKLQMRLLRTVFTTSVETSILCLFY